jgi:hypothetical protein
VQTHISWNGHGNNFSITVLEGAAKNTVAARAERLQVRDAHFSQDADGALEVRGEVSALWGVELAEHIDNKTIKGIGVAKSWLVAGAWDEVRPSSVKPGVFFNVRTQKELVSAPLAELSEGRAYVEAV